MKRFRISLSLLVMLVLHGQEVVCVELGFIENRGQVVDLLGNTRPDIKYYTSFKGLNIFVREDRISFVWFVSDNGRYTVSEASSQMKFVTNGIKSRLIKRVDFKFGMRNGRVSASRASSLEGYLNFYYPHCSKGIDFVPHFREIRVFDDSDHLALRIESSFEGISFYLNDQLTRAFQSIIHELASSGYSIEKRSGNDYLIVNAGRSSLSQHGCGYWSTYYGGNQGAESIQSVKYSNGSIVFTGFTNSIDYPVTAGVFQTSLAGNLDVMLAKMTDSGSLMWSTYYGGTNEDRGRSVCVGPDSGIVFVGNTRSSDFPTSSGAFQTVYGGGSSSGGGDGFVVKMSPNGTRQWAMYYGGQAEDWIQGVDISSQNSICVVGTTEGGIVTTSGSFQQTYQGGPRDGFVIRLSSSGALMWSSYLGGILGDSVYGLRLDVNDNIYIW